MKYTVIDVGSNTVRLAVYEVEKSGFSLVFSKRFTIGLAGYIQDKRMSQDGIRKACETLTECRAISEQFQTAQTFVFATACLRNIENTEEATDQIFLATGYSIDVISGQTEAFLDYYGIQAEIPEEQGLLFDIGGGSTEIVTFAYDGPGIVESLPIGSLNLSKRYVEKLFPKTKEQEIIRERIRKELKKRKLQNLPTYDLICGIGGTARTIRNLIRMQQGIADNERIITVKQLKLLEKLLWKKDAAAKEMLLQNCPDRLHTIYTGMLILDELAALTQCSRIYISQSGAREGYLRRELKRLASDADKQE